MSDHPSRKTVRTGSKITCESWQRTVRCCPQGIDVVVLGSINLLPLRRSCSKMSILKIRHYFFLVMIVKF
ncbi:MAG: hypothetical protein HWN67_11225 [Candidatus Helarchaeota archaeon]|nr:hypothetical protein [Candidatus Helarchaeota archaeon]